MCRKCLILRSFCRFLSEEKEAGELGFEPRQADPESAVLPLHHSPSYESLITCHVLRISGSCRCPASGAILGRVGRLGSRWRYFRFAAALLAILQGCQILSVMGVAFKRFSHRELGVAGSKQTRRTSTTADAFGIVTGIRGRGKCAEDRLGASGGRPRRVRGHYLPSHEPSFSGDRTSRLPFPRPGAPRTI